MDLAIQKQKAIKIIKRFVPAYKYDSPWHFTLDKKKKVHQLVANRLIKLLTNKVDIINGGESNSISKNAFLDQDDNTAWAGMFFEIFIRLFPCQFADFAVRLFKDGVAYIGDNCIDLQAYKLDNLAGKKLTKEEKPKYRYNVLDTSRTYLSKPTADWMILSSLYATFFVKNYDGINNTKYKGSWPKNFFKKEMEPIPFCKITSFSQGGNDKFLQLDRYGPNTAIWQVKPAFLKEVLTDCFSCVDLDASQHCIVVQDIILDSPGYYDVTYWRVGLYGPITRKKMGITFLKANVITEVMFEV